MLTLISESAAQVNLPLVTIDPGTIVFTLINTPPQRLSRSTSRSSRRLRRRLPTS